MYVFSLAQSSVLCDSVTFHVSGDVGSFLLQLSKGLVGHRCPEEWVQSLKERDNAKEKANRLSPSFMGVVLIPLCLALMLWASCVLSFHFFHDIFLTV